METEKSLENRIKNEDDEFTNVFSTGLKHWTTKLGYLSAFSGYLKGAYSFYINAESTVPWFIASTGLLALSVLHTIAMGKTYINKYSK
mgnify:FL=1